MSPSRSDTGTDVTADPLRPGDHADTLVGTATEITQPALGFTGWLRWAWRQLTSMRTALVLLLFLAIAAVPGSLFPQRSADPNGVIQWERDNPDVFPLADAVGLFDVYLSPWFSAIYLLLFTSLPLAAAPAGLPDIFINRDETDHDGLPQVTLRLTGNVEDLFPPAVDATLSDD